MTMKVWWIPQIPGKPFEVEIDTVEEGVKLMDTLASYDLFQYENGIKPDYCNIGGISVFDPTDDTDDMNGSWTCWYDEETGEDDPVQYLADKGDKPCMLMPS